MNQTTIFPYFIDDKQLWADPIAVERTLTAYCNGDPKTLAAQVESQNPDQSCRATEQLKRAICAAFGLSPFDPKTGAGTGEEELRKLLADFLAWREKKKLTLELSPTSVHVMELEQPSTAGPEWAQVFTSLMDCGCT